MISSYFAKSKVIRTKIDADPRGNLTITMTIRHFLRLRHEAIYAAQILLGNSRKSYSYDATVRSNDMRIYSASAGEAIQIALFMSKIMSPTKFEVSKTLGFRENRRHGTDGQTGGRGVTLSGLLSTTE